MVVHRLPKWTSWMWTAWLWLALCWVWVAAQSPDDPTELEETLEQWQPTLIRHARLPKRDIQRFRSYKDVNVLPFHMPPHTHFASFNFSVAEWENYSVVRKCRPRNVTVVLKFGSFPVVNPDGARYPDDYITQRVPHYERQFLSNGTPNIMNVTNPVPGEWYAIAFLSYTDPSSDQILQQGLHASCVAQIEATLDIEVNKDVEILGEDSSFNGVLEDSGTWKYFKFYVPSDTWMVIVNVTMETCKDTCPQIDMAARSRAFPEVDAPSNTTLNVSCKSKTITFGENCVLSFRPYEDSWYYMAMRGIWDKKVNRKKDISASYKLEVTFEKDNPLVGAVSSNTSLALQPEVECSECWPRIPLTRQSYILLFMFNYIRLPDPTKPSNLSQSANISTVVPTMFSFPIFPVKDIGGTFTFKLRLDRTSALDNVTSESNGVSALNVSVVACLAFATKQEPRFPDSCVDVNTGMVTPASIRVNTTSTATHTGKYHVPFPEPGRWYLSLRAFCFVNRTDDEIVEMDCAELNSTQVTFVLDSEMCGFDSCGLWGHCNNYLSGGVIFSTCVCHHGYRGWGCTDDSQIDKLSDLKLAAFLLTLSNLPFLAAAIVAARRGYSTEAFVYCCTLFFSTFYHACEAGEDVYSFCIMKLPVLQFCDFYSAILALWVTLIAMAELPQKFESFAHMAGAVGIALGTEYDRTSLAVFLIPTLVGLVIMTIQWGLICRANRTCYPHKNYWKFCFPPGVMLVLVGIICYSFLQTRNNYKYVHSAWHSIMAVAIIFVLPMRRHRTWDAVESDESVDSATPFWRRRKFWLCKMR